MAPGVGILADLTNAGISVARGNYADAALSMAAAVPIVGTAAGAGKLAHKASKLAKPSLSAHKKALKKVHKEVGKLPKGKPGKFGSPQAGNAKKGYRLDPPHDRASKGKAESKHHFNWWDYTKGKRGKGGRKGAVAIED